MNNEQIDFLINVGIDPDLPYDELEDAVATYLELHGFDADYNPTDDGLMCESILDYIGNL